jgi:hypothetical protein
VVVLISGKVEGNSVALNYEYLTLGLYLPGGIGIKVVEGSGARWQRASEGPEQSAAGCRYQVVERAGMGLFYIGRDAVVLGDLTVDTKVDRLFFRRDVGTTDFALERLHLHP